MTYDVKIYEGRGEEAETIRNLTESQMITITDVLFRHKISHLVKNLETDEIKTVSFGETFIEIQRT